MRVQRDPGYYYIKVKIKSLAAEAKIIRREEQKARAHGNSHLRVGLADHRRGIVRHEARHAQLAYGFLRGTPYKAMEAKCHGGCAPDFKKVRASIEKYGCEMRWGQETRDEFKARQTQMLADFDKWVEEAKA